MEQSLSVQDLSYQLAELPPGDTQLFIDLKGRSPDDAFTSVPYVKGHLFLLYLEEKFGRETFDIFLSEYFEYFAFQSVSTAEFKMYIEDHLMANRPNVIDSDKLDEWLFEQGLPADSPKPKSSVFSDIDIQIGKLLTKRITLQSLPTKNWTVHQWLHFINNLPRKLSLDFLKKLDSTFLLTQSKNAEIAHAWFLLAITNNYQGIMPTLEKYLIDIGRRKLIVPLYRALLIEGEFDLVKRRAWVASIYQKAKPGYHQLAQRSVEKLLNHKE